MCPWYLLWLTYGALGLWHSLSQQWSCILKLCFGIEGRASSRSSVSAARPDWEACIKAGRGSTLWQFTLFTCYYDGNAALFRAAHAPKRSLHLTIALTAWKITTEQPVNIGKRVSSSKSVLFHQETWMHSTYCIPFLPPPFLPPCRCCCWTLLSFSSADQELKTFSLLLVYLMSFVSVRRGPGTVWSLRRLWGLRRGNGWRRRRECCYVVGV